MDFVYLCIVIETQNWAQAKGHGTDEVKHRDDNWLVLREAMARCSLWQNPSFLAAQVQSALFLFGYFLFLVTERERTSIIHY